MLTIKKRSRASLAIVAATGLLLTGCGPPGVRALHKGDRLIRSGKFDAAVEELLGATRLLADNPKPVQARAWNFLGLAYQGAGDARKARDAYGQAHTLDPNLAAADYNLGCLELAQNNLPAAKDAFTTYTTLLRVRDYNGYLKLGVVWLHLAMQTPAGAEKNRQLDSAKKALEMAQRIQAGAETANDLGLLDLQRRLPPNAETVSNAMRQFNLALTRDPQYSPAILNLAILYDKYGGDERKALATYNRYLQLAPPPPQAKRVALLSSNLDHALRIQIGSAPETSLLPATVSSNGITILRHNPSRPPARPAETNPPGAPPVDAPRQPAASGDVPRQPAASGDVPRRRASTAPEIPEAGVISSHPAISSAPVNDVAAGKNEAADENARGRRKEPLESADVPKSSVLAKINPLNWFGKKPRPAAGHPAAPAAPETDDVVPGATLPPPPAARPVARYAPPPVAVYAGDRPEAERRLHEGALAENESHFKDAVRSYQDALKADPSYFEASLALGMAAIKAGEMSAALEGLHHAVTLQPETADACYAYAWALQKQNYFQDAANELEKMLAAHPSETRAHLLLANLYANPLGQPDLAREHYKKVLETDPHNAQALKIRSWLQANP